MSLDPRETAEPHDSADAQRLLVESRKLQKATESLLEMQGVDDVLRIVCAEAERLTGAVGSAILLRQDGPVPASAYKHGQALPHDSKRGGLEQQPPERSFLELPLTVRGHHLGTLVLLGREGGFHSEGVALAEHFADQAATAIQHALFHEQHEQLLLLEERQKLAHELHDSVTQSIYGVTLFAEAATRLLETRQTAEAAKLLQELQETALSALREMRMLVFELRPPMLHQEGLAAALEARLAAVEGRAGLTTNLRVDAFDDHSWPTEVAEALYGIAKEALNNVLKHAGASRVSVHLRQTGVKLELEITDDGVGFEPASASRGEGFGLQGMRERAAGINALLTISSRRGRGTKVKAGVSLANWKRLARKR
jgi:signal transduction histidine kinase